MMAKYPSARQLVPSIYQRPTPTKQRMCVLWWCVVCVQWCLGWTPWLCIYAFIFASLSSLTLDLPSPPPLIVPPSQPHTLQAPPQWASSRNEAAPGRHQAEEEVEEAAVAAAVAGDGENLVDEAVDGASQAVGEEEMLLARRA